ncbi:fumarylacetoacetate hydrolase family protein [Methylobacterium haplocladii]|uniref:2-hydroxyhepta-2,4-diene-1,7-dioate isomerase n=1 Tax=Methylobacterium haplocladii TaxID=1176176 RepID=A0A512IT73_9HYPH|nr:fumarylacetoacetate hydrolase family protein [Methylobacterium haplocladii]GEP00902.1 2-hydroxyhepta-2,4-diene-1,7-dioate isomerase [Methylobacterium haplocladii]GJD82228.1 Ureidoglycolate lyase [Methylobacterium haplocladii]GLS58866.1 2-hydroxyhepta-2,4-diene-1,7-dioate isomerase [Methylobacterium haplocladii]
MKLIRHGAAGDEKPGLVDAKGGLRDLSGSLRDIAGPALSRQGLDRLAMIDPETLPLLPAGTRLGPCVGGTRNIVAIGLNYADHAAETGAAIPSEPIVFNKAPSCLGGANDPVILPKGSAKTDWEVELAVVIGARASYVHANEALDYVAGACIMNDLSEREYQYERGGTWTKGKGCPTFGPLGPWLVTLDEIPDLKKLSLSLDLNGRRQQTGSTATMVFDVAQLVAYVSHFMMLEPGDIITTGTPPGVGLGMKPPRFLKPDDEMVLRIDGLGEQRQTVIAFDDWTAKVAAGEPTN